MINKALYQKLKSKSILKSISSQGEFMSNAQSITLSDTQKQEIFNAYIDWTDSKDFSEVMRFKSDLLGREIPRLCNAALLSRNTEYAMDLIVAIASRKEEISPENWALLCSTRDRLKTVLEKGGWLPVVSRADISNKTAQFPRNVFPPEIEAYLESVSKSVQVPREMPSAAALAAFALCLQGKYMTEYPDFTEHTEHLSLYVGIVADPSERKSPVYKAVINKPFYKWAESAKERYNADMSEYKANSTLIKKRIEAIERSAKGDITADKRDELVSLYAQLDSLKAPASPYFIFDDTTPEALVRGLAETGEAGGIFSEEGDVLDIIAGRYSDKGSANIGIFLKAYNGENFRSTRVTSGEIQLKRPLLSMCLMLQPEIYKRIVTNKTLQGRGCIARFLFAHPEKSTGKRQAINLTPPDSTGQAAYENLIYSFLDTEAVPDSDMRVLKFCDEIKGNKESLMGKYLQAIENSMTEGGSMSDESAYAGKAGGTLMRIAGILHLVWGYDERTPISEETAQRAVAIHKYFLLEKCREMKSSVKSEREQADKVMGYLIKTAEKKMTAEIAKREFFSNFRRRCNIGTVKELDSILELLESENKIETCTVGRRNKIYISPYMRPHCPQ